MPSLKKSLKKSLIAPLVFITLSHVSSVLAGQQAFIDPATGNLTANPSPEAIQQAETVKQQHQVIPRQPVLSVLPDGSTMATGPFMVNIHAQVDEHGMIKISESSQIPHPEPADHTPAAPKTTPSP